MAWLTLATVPLLLLSPALADKRTFSVHDDILGYPQFQIYFSDDYILDSDVNGLLRRQRQAGRDFDSNGPYSSPGQIQVPLAEKTRDKLHVGGYDHENYDKSDIIYEQMMLNGQPYLCSIPRVDTENSVNASGKNDASLADEGTELARATDRGLELLHEMDGKCLYHVDGYWSYSFCYQKQIKQFRALPSARGATTYPPIEDPTARSFVLGKFQAWNSDDTDGDDKRKSSDITELQTKGGTRYLVQRLAGGTTCDLTGRERKIEVQFHCHPQSSDQIGWIKELTTCTYLMMIYTPRLCNDVAFLPPQQDEVHSIECHAVIASDAVSEWISNLDNQDSQELGEPAPSRLPVVGEIEVGAQKLVGGEGKQIEKGRVASIGEERVDVIAKRENGEIKRLSAEDLKRYDLDSEKIEQLKRRLEELANGRDWRLEVIESNGARGLQGIVGTDDEGDTGVQEKSDTGAEEAEAAAEGEVERPKPRRNRKESSQADLPQKEQREEAKGGNDGGREETFKDEL